MCTQTRIRAQGCNQTRIQAPSVLILDQQGIQIKASNCDQNVTITQNSKQQPKTSNPTRPRLLKTQQALTKQY
jgi:hypothetical protein